MSDEEEAQLRKEALAAQAEYHRLQSAKLAAEIAEKEQRRDLVRSATTKAGDVAVHAGRTAVFMAKVGAGLVAIIVVYFLYANATEKPKPGSDDVEATERRNKIEDCASGRITANNWKIVRTFDGRLGYTNAADADASSRTCAEVTAGSWPPTR